MNGGDGLRCFSPRLTLAILNGSADTAAMILSAVASSGTSIFFSAVP